MRARISLFFLPFTLVFLLGLACNGSSNTGRKVGEQNVAVTATAVKPVLYKVGDIVQVGEHTITLTNATIQNGTLTATFSIENTGSEEISISSLLSFEARDAEGNKLEQSIFDCDSSSLDGKVLPGDRLKGSICWTAPGAGPFRIYYEAELFGSGAVVWEVK